MANFIDPQDLIDKDIFELLNMKDAPEAKKKEITDNMLQTVQNRVLARILDTLEEPEVRQYEELIDAGDEQKMVAFLNSKNIDLNNLTAEEALRYKTEIVNLISAKKDAQANTTPTQ